jgi:hypothetical protein
MSSYVKGPPETYITVSQLRKILGEAKWSRTNVYYWLRKCRIDLVDIAGHKFVPVSNLPSLVMTLQKAKDDAHTKGQDERSTTTE